MSGWEQTRISHNASNTSRCKGNDSVLAMLKIAEIFTSLQGESAFAGYPCIFIRLAGCNLRCVWCDTRYSYNDSAQTMMSIDGIIAQITSIPVDLVEITGGEPLLQSGTPALCHELLRLGYKVMIETNGSVSIASIPPQVRRVIDIKCPGSGFGGSFLLDNLNHITQNDELKFVVASIDDAVWAKAFCDDRQLVSKCAAITFSPVTKTLPGSDLAGWMIENGVNGVRLGLQLHKIIKIP